MFENYFREQVCREIIAVKKITGGLGGAFPDTFFYVVHDLKDKFPKFGHLC